MENLELKEGQILILSAPRIEHIMTGVTFCSLSKNNIIILEYEDGKKESAKCTDEEWKNFSGLIDITSFVQSKRLEL